MKIIIDADGVRYNTMHIVSYFVMSNVLLFTLMNVNPEDSVINTNVNVTETEEVLKKIDDFMTNDQHVLDLRISLIS